MVRALSEMTPTVTLLVRRMDSPVAMGQSEPLGLRKAITGRPTRVLALNQKRRLEGAGSLPQTGAEEACGAQGVSDVQGPDAGTSGAQSHRKECMAWRTCPCLPMAWHGQQPCPSWCVHEGEEGERAGGANGEPRLHNRLDGLADPVKEQHMRGDARESKSRREKHGRN